MAQSSVGPFAGEPIEIAGDAPNYLEFGAGAFNVLAHQTSPAPEGQVQFRFGKKLLYIGPVIGVLANTQGGIFGYAGFYSDIRFGRFVMTPLAGAGAYSRGGSEDLGGVFQFRLSFALSYKFDNRSRLGVQFGHISNAGIHARNPSDNEALLTYAIPLSLPF